MAKAGVMAALSSLQLAAKMFQASKQMAPYFQGRPSYANGYNLPSNMPPYRSLTGSNQPPKPWTPSFTKYSGKRKYPGSFKGNSRKGKKPRTTIAYCRPRLPVWSVNPVCTSLAGR